LRIDAFIVGLVALAEIAKLVQTWLESLGPRGLCVMCNVEHYGTQYHHQPIGLNSEARIVRYRQ